MSEAATLERPDEAHEAEVTLADRILRAIAKATSARPANAGDVAATVGGPEADYWRALEGLLHDKRVASAHITKPPAAPYIAIWPTGVVTPLARLDGDALSWMFVRHEKRLHDALHATTAPRCRPVVITERPPRHPAAPAATPKELPVKTRQSRQRGELMDAVLAAVAGRGPAEALSCAQIQMRVAPDKTRSNMSETLKRLAERGAIGQTKGAAPGWPTAPWFYFDASLAQPNTATTASRAAMAAAGLGAIADAIPSMEPEPTPAHPPERAPAQAAPVRFALWDSGVLAIHDDDTVLEIPPPDVARLARLLGVPLNNSPV